MPWWACHRRPSSIRRLSKKVEEKASDKCLISSCRRIPVHHSSILVLSPGWSDAQSNSTT